jgi:uncharacterized protein (TIGR02996 family)
MRIPRLCLHRASGQASHPAPRPAEGGVAVTHHDGFLRAIMAEPEADSHRLVYADWLDEHGDPERAEFIRVQCAVEKVRAACLCGDCVRRRGGGQHHNGPCGLDRREHGFPRHRERELLASHQVDWRMRDLPGMPFGNWVTDFRRGFVAEVTLPCGQWMRHGPALVRAAPLERVILPDRHRSRWARGGGLGDYYWVEQHGPTAHLPDRLPAPLFAFLPPGLPDQDGVMTYETGDAAREALSHAALAWARNPARPG